MNAHVLVDKRHFVEIKFKIKYFTTTVTLGIRIPVRPYLRKKALETYSTAPLSKGPQLEKSKNNKLFIFPQKCPNFLLELRGLIFMTWCEKSINPLSTIGSNGPQNES